VNLPEVTHEQLVEFCDHARRKFYLSPRYLVHKALQSVKSPAELKRNLMGFVSLAKYLVAGSFTKAEKGA